MKAGVSERLIEIANTVASAAKGGGGAPLSALHAALLASRLFEAIKAERAALHPADHSTRAVLDHALGDCASLARAGESLAARLQAVSGLLATSRGRGGKMVAPPLRAQARRAFGAPRRDAACPPPPRLRLFRLIEGGRAT